MADTAHPPAGLPAEPDTTGHEWDGIREYNNPLPRWWLLTLYATIVWAFGYWIAYPAWPLIASHTGGILGYSSRAEVLAEVDRAKAARTALGQDRLASAALGEIKADPALLSLALATGKAAFGDNCAGCHGTAATGRVGYPNLQDDDWLWGGSLDAIAQTIRVGIRSGHADARQGDMPAFGRDGVLKRDEVETVANYVLSLSGKAFNPALSLQKGAEVFAQNCAACHGDQAKGNPELGAPDLTDAVWLYGSAPEQVIATITNGRKGVMPTWEGRLDTATIKSLAVYVHSLGGGK
ncbi:cytochrome c oxidase, cbb3-type, subunit III [Methylobacterium sp. 4-46]|uniref:cytochrome-c oxidase, cbb3-type subunit III n=1 Tax=unclassified Methylobacterium TaxID=2615210 RepID=UPI000152D0EC|nr:MULTISPECIES: cytochrome-c oxidase, cbb3-type subunit III [Methylobacterium]ACA17678.1 cytochrome c oxidase, cbb3-type, subunit III [Methylobacterium sp. 4-46]WFT83347.1 cytochrome-c oxidase, cbb3-type subunit III [Methylobacterium nodulans]